MRNDLISLKQSLIAGEDLIYCFEIFLSSGILLLLTSSNNIISFKEKSYQPNSGLNIITADFNDSAYNKLNIFGIFEEGGIVPKYDLQDATFKIYTYNQGRLNYLFTYYCSVYHKHDLSFTLCLESEIKKYNQSLLKKFSRNCRANLGDNKCGVNKGLYSYRANIIELNDVNLIISSIKVEDGYFDYGIATFMLEYKDNYCYNRYYSVKINKHIKNIITLESCIPSYLKILEQLTLIAGCDKKIITCCNKFSNSINFRGEPFISENNILTIKD